MNKTQIYMLVKSEFMEKKARAEALAYENLIQAKQDTTFADLFHKERTLRFDIAKNKSRRLPTNILEQELIQTITAKNKRLSELNIIEKTLSPIYECKKCEDSGYLKNGKMCSCFDKRLKEKLIQESSQNLTNLPTFDSFNEKVANTPEHQTQLSKLKKIMKSWIDSTETNKHHLVFISGDTGVGKTFLTECIQCWSL